jgi:hypothetical protein
VIVENHRQFALYAVRFQALAHPEKFFFFYHKIV